MPSYRYDHVSSSPAWRFGIEYEGKLDGTVECMMDSLMDSLSANSKGAHTALVREWMLIRDRVD